LLDGATQACGANRVWTLTTILSRLSGFSKKSDAPSFIAATASCTVAWPLITMTGRSEWRRPHGAGKRIEPDIRAISSRISQGLSVARVVEQFQCTLRTFRFDDLVTFAVKDHAQGSTNVSFVVHDEHAA